MTPLKITFVVLASMNILISVFKLIKPIATDRHIEINSIIGWSCAIIYSID